MRRNEMVVAMSYGFTMIFLLGGSFFLGYTIDQYLHTTPLFIILFALYVFVAGTIYLYKKVSGNDGK